MRVATKVLVVVLMSLVASVPSVFAEEEENKANRYRGGALRFGGSFEGDAERRIVEEVSEE